MEADNERKRPGEVVPSRGGEHRSPVGRPDLEAGEVVSVFDRPIPPLVANLPPYALNEIGIIHEGVPVSLYLVDTVVPLHLEVADWVIVVPRVEGANLSQVTLVLGWLGPTIHQAKGRLIAEPVVSKVHVEHRASSVSLGYVRRLPCICRCIALGAFRVIVFSLPEVLVAPSGIHRVVHRSESVQVGSRDL